MGSFPRPLTDDERALIARLLDDAAPRADGIDALRAQLDSTTVVGKCPCGCASVDLQVDEGTSTQSEFRGLVNGDPSEGATPEGQYWGLIIFAQSGWLESLEVYGEDGGDAGAPLTFPSPDEVDDVWLSHSPR